MFRWIKARYYGFLEDHYQMILTTNRLKPSLNRVEQTYFTHRYLYFKTKRMENS